MANKASEKVNIKLFRAKGYEAPVQVWLNGIRYSVPRGVEVEVPAGVAEIIEHAENERQKQVTFLSKQTQ